MSATLGGPSNLMCLPYRRPPLIECPDCGRPMSDVQKHGVVLERFCAACNVVYVEGPRS